MSSSIHDKQGRVRPPRVRIRYDVETGGAPIKKELPFVMGIMGDFSGNPVKPLESLEDRKFIEIDRDNFNDILKRMAPALSFRVENTLAGDGSELPVQLKFDSMQDFEPGSIVNQVEPLRKLLETRDKLKDLLATIDTAQPALERKFEEILKQTQQLQALAAERGITDEGKGGDQ